MKVTDIPFVKHIGIELQESDHLSLELKPNVENHIQTIHAAAQFALAETGSGLFLQSLFPEHADSVIPLLRSSTVKYKHPARKKIRAIAHIDSESKDKFEKQFLKKGRAQITIQVEIKDSNDVTTMVGEFGWFVSGSGGF